MDRVLLENIEIDQSEIFREISPKYVSLQQLLKESSTKDLDSVSVTNIDVVEATTLSVCQSLDKTGLVLLTFTSSSEYGSGYLCSEKSQENSICRASNLYSVFRSYPYVEDHLLVSSGVTIYRNEHDNYIQPYRCTVISAQADKDEQVMERLIAGLIALTTKLECNTLVLGAWGCGFHKHDAETVAKMFKTHLGHTSIPKITFAIPNKEIADIFRKTLHH